MALLDDDMKVVEERNRKQLIGHAVVWTLVGLLIFFSTVRAIVLIFFPNSWVTKYLFN